MNYRRIDKSSMAGADLLLAVKDVMSESKESLSNAFDFLNSIKSQNESIVGIANQINAHCGCDVAKELEQFADDVREPLTKVQSLYHDYMMAFSANNDSTTHVQLAEDAVRLADATNVLFESLDMLESAMMNVHSQLRDLKSEYDKSFQILLNASEHTL